ncbi:MAG: hypothetical protein NTZ69_19310 [Bacteroidia bacterium]|nr:hypothetical protein [Bacteroidia bacterium]
MRKLIILFFVLSSSFLFGQEKTIWCNGVTVWTLNPEHLIY